MFDGKKLTFKEKYYWFRGLLRRRSHFNRAGQPKVGMSTYQNADKARRKMQTKMNRTYDVYRCLWCRKYHIGGTVKTLRKKNFYV